MNDENQWQDRKDRILSRPVKRGKDFEDLLKKLLPLKRIQHGKLLQHYKDHPTADAGRALELSASDIVAVVTALESDSEPVQ